MPTDQGPNHPQDAATISAHNAELLKLAHQAPRCMHVRPNGLRCGSPAMRGACFCYFHNEYYNGSSENTFPPLEDGNGVQLALMQVVERLRRETFRGGAVDPRLIKPLLYALQTASHNLRHTNFDPVLAQPITEDVALTERRVTELRTDALRTDALRAGISANAVPGPPPKKAADSAAAAKPAPAGHPDTGLTGD